MSKFLESVGKIAQFTMLVPLKEEVDCEICAELGESVKADWNVGGHKLCAKHSIKIAQTKAVHKDKLNSTN
jgi:hypothetical protein